MSLKCGEPLHVGHGARPNRSLSAGRRLQDFPHTRISSISQDLQPIWLDLQIRQVKIDEPRDIVSRPSPSSSRRADVTTLSSPPVRAVAECPSARERNRSGDQGLAGEVVSGHRPGAHDAAASESVVSGAMGTHRARLPGTGHGREMGCLRREPCRVPAPQLDRKRGVRGLVLPASDGWHISAAETSSGRARKVSAELNRVLLELVLSTIVLGEPAAGLRAEL